jgi:hypothetical protein
VNPDLAKAARALEFGDPVEARVHAWNALETIDPVEAGQLRRIAEELGDTALVEAVERRDFKTTASDDEPQFRFRYIAIPVAMFALIIGLVTNDLLSESHGPKMDEARTAGVVPQTSPIVTESDGIWLVRVGNLERVPLDKLALDLSHRHGLVVGVLPAIDPLPESVVDEIGSDHRELDGDDLLTLLEKHYRARGRATIIGITDFNMHGRDRSREPFMLRDYAHYAVISTADLGAGPLDRWRGHTRYERTRKLVGRGIGFLYLMRPVSDDPKSLMRSEMSGTDDIDALRERL